MYKSLNIANFHAFHVLGKRILSCNDTTFFLHFFPFFASAAQLFSTPVMSSNLRNQAPLFTELRLLQGTKTYCSFGHNFFKKQPFRQFFMRILAINYGKYLATLGVAPPSLCATSTNQHVATAWIVRSQLCLEENVD